VHPVRPERKQDLRDPQEQKERNAHQFRRQTSQQFEVHVFRHSPRPPSPFMPDKSFRNDFTVHFQSPTVDKKEG
jgi:hypothetical protein